MPLALSMVFDIYVIAQIILEDFRVSVIIAAASAFVLLGLWYVMPRFANVTFGPTEDPRLRAEK